MRLSILLEASIFRPLDYQKRLIPALLVYRDPFHRFLRRSDPLTIFKREAKIWENIWYFGK
jgi:hypothetical protein